MAMAVVSESWMTPLGILKARCALGLLVWIAFALIGTAAAIGLICSLSRHLTHLRAHTTSFRPGRLFPPTGRGRVGIATICVVTAKTLQKRLCVQILHLCCVLRLFPIPAVNCYSGLAKSTGSPPYLFLSDYGFRGNGPAVVFQKYIVCLTSALWRALGGAF